MYQKALTMALTLEQKLKRGPHKKSFIYHQSWWLFDITDHKTLVMNLNVLKIIVPCTVYVEQYEWKCQYYFEHKYVVYFLYYFSPVPFLQGWRE